MIRKTQLRAALIVASSSLMLSACVDQESDVASQNNTTRESALLSAFSVGPTTQTIDEGGSASVNVSLLCVNNTTDNVVITANWGDSSTPSQRTFPTTGLTTQGACLSGYVEVCGGTITNPDCGSWTHTYADNGAGFPVSFVATQGVETTTQNVTVVVNNLPPVVDLVRTGADFEGVNADFVLGVNDPGLLSTEIAGATWTWTPSSGVNDPTVINCTCANAIDCDDGSNLTICGETNGRLTDTRSRIYLDNGAYTLTVVVTDKEGAQTTVTRASTIANLPPENVAVKIDTISISTDSLNPTPLIEGKSYNFLGSLNEPGIDALTFNWNLGDGTTRSGTGLVTKAGYPVVGAITPTDALAFSYTYDNVLPALTNPYTVSFIAADDDGGSGTRTGFVRVSDVNPVINSFTGDTTVTEGGSVTYTVNAVSGAETASFDPIVSYDWDIDGAGNGSAPNHYTVTSGCGLTDTNCVIQFLDGNNSYTVQVDVNDEDSNTLSPTSTVTVNNNPVALAPISPLLGIFEAASTTLTYTFADAAGSLDGLYSISVDWNDGTTPFTTTHAAPGSFTTPPHTYADNSLCTNPSAGVCTISVTVCEVLDNITPNAGCDTKTTTIVVTNVLPSPTIIAFGALEEGKPFNLAGSFTDPAGLGDAQYLWTWSGFDIPALQTGSSSYPAGTALNVTDGGRFTGPDNGVTATKVITLTVEDGDGGSNSITANAQVLDNTPIISDITQVFVPSQQDDEPAIAALDIDIEAETNDDLLKQVVVNWGDPLIPNSVVTTGVNGVGTMGTTISVTAPSAYIESGTYTATVTLSDEDSTTTDTIQITVLNVAPTISLIETTPPAPAIVTEGQSFSLRATATDPSTVDAQTLTFQTNWGDTSSDFATGSVTAPGTARSQFSHVYTNPGTYTVTLTVTDPDGGSDTSTLTVEVLNRAPTITDAFNSGPVDENTSVTAVMLVNNPGADTLRYSFNFDTCTPATVDNSDFPAPEVTPGTGTSAVRSKIYPNQGSFPVCMRVCDDDGPNFGCDYAFTTVTVNNVAPRITSFLPPAAVTESAAGASVNLVAVATDVGPNDVLTYAFDCDSNGTTDFTNTTGLATCTYIPSGTYTATVTVSDADGGSTFATTQVRVNNAAPTISNVAGTNANEGSATTVTVTATDLGGDALSYRFDFDNDGQYEITKATNSATWTFQADGVKTVGVQVCDSKNACAQSTTTVTIANVAPAIVSVVPASPITTAEGQTVAITLVASDASTTDAQSLTIMTNWGDGNSDTTTGSATGTPGQARAQLAHVYTSPGTYTATMTVSDNLANVVATSSVTVTNRTPSITDVFNTSPVNEGSSSTTVVMVSNPGADTLRYSFNFACAAGPVDDTDFADAAPGTGTSANGTFTYPNQGSFPVCVRVCDDDGPAFGCDYGQTTVTVNNVAPQITGFPTPAAVTESSTGAVVALSATATDAGPNDVLTYAFDCTGDGTADTTNTTGTASCTYASSGIYTATVTVSDADGGSAFATTQVRVNNAAPTISNVAGLNVNEGNATTVTITAADIGGDTLSYRFDFNNDGQYEVTKATNSATWTFPTDGVKTVGVEVCDTKNACAQGTTTLTVANVAPTILSVSTPSSVSRGTAVTVIVDATDAGNDKLSYSFNVKDSSGASVFNIGPQASNITTATIADSGAYTVDVTVTDTATAPATPLTDTATSSFTVTDISVAVNVIANPSSINEGGSTTITVTPSGTGPYLVRYDINGDGDFNDAEDIVPSGPSDTCVTCSAPNIVYADNRSGNLPYRVLVEVTDTGEADAIATALVSVTVTNVAPAIAAIADITNAPEQTPLTVAVLGTDVGTLDTIEYSLVSGPAGIAVDSTTGVLTWTPDWSDEGATSVTVRATDKDGGKSDETLTVTVTIIDTNGNLVSDTRERELNNGQLLPADAGTTDTDGDGVTDLQEVLDGTDPNVSDAPSAPLILSPDNEAISVLRPTLTVVNAESPRGLELEYTFVVTDSTNTVVTTLTGVAEGVNTTSVEVDVDLAEDAVYTWYAFAEDIYAVGEDSQTGEFNVNTANSAPPVPQNLTPLDMAVLPSGVLAALELRAVVDPDGDTVSYEFEVSTDVMFNTIVAQSELRSVPFYSIPEALPAGKYFWHGRASDGTDTSAFGTATFFTIEESATNTAPPAPTIVKPDGVVLATASATLEIEGVVDADGDDVQYIIEIADNAAFAGADSSGLQTELTYDVTGLTEDTTYFWRARSSDGLATSEWVSASFAVNAQNSAPTGLAIVSPAPGALLERAPEGLVWAEATDADGDTLTYTVELATTADFAEILYTEDFAAGDSVAVPTEVTFDAELTYYWRVTVSDGTDSEVVNGSFDLYSAPIVSTGGGDDGCGCSSVAKPADRQPMALIFGLMMAGLLVMRRRKRD